VNDISAPVFISQGSVIRVDDAGEYTSGAFLNAPEAALACIQILWFLHVAGMQKPFFENIIDTPFFDTVSAAAGTILSKFDGGILADGMESGFGCFHMNMIFFGHNKLLNRVTLV
jgi:hypothetical protein